MKKLHTIAFFIGLVLLIFSLSGFTQESLCQPDSYQTNQDYCNVAGPAQTLTHLAEQGQTYPPRPFAPQTLDPSLSTVPFQYAKLNLEDADTAPLYGSAVDAMAGVNPISMIPAGGIRYVSYSNRVDEGKAHFVQSKKGTWLRASPAAVAAGTLGRTFSETPSNYFGWIFESCHPYTAPNYNSGTNPNVQYNREQVVEIFEVIREKDNIWVRVGENQWLDRIHFRGAFFNTTPPAGVTADRWIEVDLAEQVVMVYDHRQLVYAVMAATGMKPFYTQPGVFTVYEKKEAEDMTGAFESDKSDFYSLEDVPFVLYYDQARAFHGAYWRAWYGFEQSHGCINMSIGDAHWLYNWTNVGDFVWVHDPSGITPTDPSYYGAGGA